MNRWPLSRFKRSSATWTCLRRAIPTSRWIQSSQYASPLRLTRNDSIRSEAIVISRPPQSLPSMTEKISRSVRLSGADNLGVEEQSCGKVRKDAALDAVQLVLARPSKRTFESPTLSACNVVLLYIQRFS